MRSQDRKRILLRVSLPNWRLTESRVVYMFDPLLILALITKLADALSRHQQGITTAEDRELLKQSEQLARTDFASATGHGSDSVDIGGQG